MENWSWKLGDRFATAPAGAAKLRPFSVLMPAGLALGYMRSLSATFETSSFGGSSCRAHRSRIKDSRSARQTVARAFILAETTLLLKTAVLPLLREIQSSSDKNRSAPLYKGRINTTTPASGHPSSTPTLPVGVPTSDVGTEEGRKTRTFLTLILNLSTLISI